MLQSIDQIIPLVPVVGVLLLMFSMGLRLELADFKLILEDPKLVGLGCFGQMLLLPAFGFLLCFAFSLPSHIAVGLMVIASCPGGATSNAFSVIVKGDFALSIVLTAISSLLAFLTVPLLLSLSLQAFGSSHAVLELDFFETAAHLFLNTALPITVGMLVRRYLRTIADKLARPVFAVAFTALVLPAVGFLFQFGSILSAADVLPSMTAILLNFAMVGAGFALGWLGRYPEKQNRTLAIEVGIQNYGLVLMIIATILADFSLLMPSLFYLPAMFISASLIGMLARRQGGRRPQAEVS